MVNKIKFLVLIPIIFLFSLAFAIAQNETPTIIDSQSTSTQSVSEQQNIEFTTNESEKRLDVEPGMTPDNPLYFVKDIYERVNVGNNPEKALNYKEEKIAEAQVMVEEGKPEEAKKVLDRAMRYGDIVQKETSPEIKNKVQESSEAVKNTIQDMEDKTSDVQLKQKFSDTIQQGEEISVAAELASKISELCDTLAKIDPRQYADSCRPKGDSPQWMQEKDKQLTQEQKKQAQVFFEKLSQCFESPKQCDCKGMGIQKFEDYCLEKSEQAAKCTEGNESACKSMSEGSDPSDLLPDYLVPVMKKVEAKYSKAEYDVYMPEECVKSNAKTPEKCNQVMFKANAPQECLDAGLTGKSKEDEVKCSRIMFEKNTPEECIKAGITADDKDAPRKCSKIMFQQRSPQECLDAGLTGESREDEKKCRQIIESKGNNNARVYNPSFNKDCKIIQDTNEKIKCLEEFYNNAQVQVRDDFRQREMTDSMTGEAITAEEESQRKSCADKGMGTILEHENGKRVVICVDKNTVGQQGQGGQQCQSQDEVEKLKQNCKDMGENAQVEIKGGCSWVICIRGATAGAQGQGNYEEGRYVQETLQQNQPTQTVVGGVKCPDSTCDEYEKMNPWACPEDCGGARQPGNYPQQQPGDYRPPQQEPQPNQQPGQPSPYQQTCSGQAPNCDSGAYCQNGNWICPPTQPQDQQQIAPVQPQVPQQQNIEPAQQQSTTPQVDQTPTQPTTTSEPAPPTTSTTTETTSTPAPTTGQAIREVIEFIFKR